MFQTEWLEAIYWFCQNHMKSNTGLAESMQAEAAQLFPIPCNPMDHDSSWNSPGQNTGEDLSFSRGSSQPRDQTQFSPAEPQGKPKNIGVRSLSLLQQIFPTQEVNLWLLHCRLILYQLSYQGSRALFNTDSPAGGMCVYNHEVRTDGDTNNFHQIVGIPASL